MQSIAIVEALSSGQMYMADIVARGYNPIYIISKTIADDPYAKHYRELCARNFGNKAEFLTETDDLNELIEQLRERNTVLCLPGCEYGVELAERICTAMGLIGNDSSTTYLRATKAGMAEALTKAGIRHIETAVIKEKGDIARFWKANDLDRCVMKFSESAATVGVKICSSIEEAEEHYDYLLVNDDRVVKKDKTILIQEFIGGTEYVVNTLTCNGEHMLTDIWVYNKVIQEDGTIAYDYTKLVKDLEPGHSEMVLYAYKVLDAVQMKWGPCHIEIKIDRKGPVLIETNARPMGLALTAPFLDECIGHHITDLALDAMLMPGQFKAMLLKPYNPRKYALMKLMIVPEAIKASFEPTMVFAKSLKSMREILFFGNTGVADYGRTVDLHTSPMTLKMINGDYGQLMKDYELLRLVEKNYFDIYYTSLNDVVEGCEKITDREKLISYLDPMRKYLLIDDEGSKTIQFGNVKETDTWEIVDGVIFGMCSEKTFVERVRDMIHGMSMVRSGGHFMFLPESYKNLKNGAATVEFLLHSNGFDIVAPTYYNAGILAGLKH
ncbi:MAG: ATP-grasp domain-containing protein [archaeon]|nr:ATP-grasp domain-containing protein [archaeon]